MLRESKVPHSGKRLRLFLQEILTYITKNIKNTLKFVVKTPPRDFFALINGEQKSSLVANF